MLASGGDDGCFRIWDLRNFKDGAFVANFTHHTEPITSIEWSPFESSELAVTSADHQLTVWDLSLERDSEAEAAAGVNQDSMEMDVPPQLLFVHQGQNDLKELHWHMHIPGMIISTAADGFNCFKPSNLI